MASTALTVVTHLPTVPSPASDFDLHGLRIFTSIPDHRDIGIVALHGMVVIYDEKLIQMEGIVEGSFYVRESQHPAAAMDWERWLLAEWECEYRACGQPSSLLKTRREVVKVMRRPYADNWSVQLASGHVDGPYHDWAFGRDLVGKVVGLYRPD